MMEILLQQLNFLELITIMASALGAGLLIGLERERSKQHSDEPSFAGVRSFALCALLGALCFIMNTAIAVVGAVAVSFFCIYSLVKQQKDIGSTTELAFLMTYFIGGLCVFHIPLAAGLAVLVAILLMNKNSIHHVAGNVIKSYEMRDGLFLLALVLIALPLMPNQPLWGNVLNPYVIFKLLILILGVQSLAHVAKRLLPNDKALILSSLASGFVSSTATIASLGMQVRSHPADAKSSAGAALLSCVSTLIQLLIVVIGLSMTWFKVLLIPCLIGVAILSLVALFLMNSANKSTLAHKSDTEKMPAEDSRIFSLKEALIIVVTLSVIQAGIYGLNLMLGNSGLIIGTFLASLFEVHAAMATVVMQGDVENKTLVMALMIGLIAHACSKCVNAFLTGGKTYFLYFAPTQLLHMGCLIIALLVGISF